MDGFFYFKNAEVGASEANPNIRYNCDAEGRGGDADSKVLGIASLTPTYVPETNLLRAYSIRASLDAQP